MLKILLKGMNQVSCLKKDSLLQIRFNASLTLRVRLELRLNIQNPISIVQKTKQETGQNLYLTLGYLFEVP